MPKSPAQSVTVPVTADDNDAAPVATEGLQVEKPAPEPVVDPIPNAIDSPGPLTTISHEPQRPTAEPVAQAIVEEAVVEEQVVAVTEEQVVEPMVEKELVVEPLVEKEPVEEPLVERELMVEPLAEKEPVVEPPVVEVEEVGMVVEPEPDMEPEDDETKEYRAVLVELLRPVKMEHLVEKFVQSGITLDILPLVGAVLRYLITILCSSLGWLHFCPEVLFLLSLRSLRSFRFRPLSAQHIPWFVFRLVRPSRLSVRFGFSFCSFCASISVAHLTAWLLSAVRAQSRFLVCY